MGRVGGRPEDIAQSDAAAIGLCVTKGAARRCNQPLYRTRKSRRSLFAMGLPRGEHLLFLTACAGVVPICSPRLAGLLTRGTTAGRSCARSIPVKPPFGSAASRLRGDVESRSDGSARTPRRSRGGPRCPRPAIEVDRRARPEGPPVPCLFRLLRVARGGHHPVGGGLDPRPDEGVERRDGRGDAAAAPSASHWTDRPGAGSRRAVA